MERIKLIFGAEFEKLEGSPPLQKNTILAVTLLAATIFHR